MCPDFAARLRELATAAGADAATVEADGHARWRLYTRALDDAALRVAVPAVLRLDPDGPLVSAVVTRALGLVRDRETWVDLPPAGPLRDQVRRRLHELRLLEGLADDVEACGGNVATWSPWLQLRAAESASAHQVLRALAEGGGTRQVRYRARERLRQVRPSAEGTGPSPRIGD